MRAMPAITGWPEVWNIIAAPIPAAMMPMFSIVLWASRRFISAWTVA